MAKKYNYQLPSNCTCTKMLANIGLTAIDHKSPINEDVYITFTNELTTYEKEQLDKAMEDNGYEYVDSEDV